MPKDGVCTLSGMPVSELSIEEILSGKLRAEDLRISAETLSCQADAAEAGGYPQLAENMRRAAELTRLSNQQVLDIYNCLRPGRADFNQLISWADRLETEYDAPLTAGLLREAAEVYKSRGILKSESGFIAE